MAPSASTSTKAFSVGLSASIRARERSMSATGDSSPERTSAASSWAGA